MLLRFVQTISSFTKFFIFFLDFILTDFSSTELIIFASDFSNDRKTETRRENKKIAISLRSVEQLHFLFPISSSRYVVYSRNTKNRSLLANSFLKASQRKSNISNLGIFYQTTSPFYEVSFFSFLRFRYLNAWWRSTSKVINYFYKFIARDVVNNRK